MFEELDDFIPGQYFFDVSDQSDRDSSVFVLIIYDIVNNRNRNKLAKFLEGYGFRVQKSAFEATISASKYQKLLSLLPGYIQETDSIKVYKIIGKGQVTSFGLTEEHAQEEVIVL